jgi:hypothetical protein
VWYFALLGWEREKEKGREKRREEKRRGGCERSVKLS